MGCISIRNPDGSYTVLSGARAGVTAYMEAMNRTAMIDKTSKFHSNQRVRVKNEITKIIETLMPTYRYLDARHIANSLAGSEVEVISPDLLTDSQGVWGTYYSISSDAGEFYVLPEDLLEEL